MTRSDTIAELAAALAVAQGSIQNAAKDSANPFFNSSYADLASVRDAIREPFAANGLSVIQMPTADGNKVTVTTILAHKSGEWVASDLTMVSEKSTPQAIGSAITYARRYALAAVSGVAPEDDDGEGAQDRKKAAQDVAKQKIARAKPNGAASEPADDAPPADEGAELRRDAEQAEEGSKRKPKTKRYDILQAFAALKKRYAAVGHPETYYLVLERNGVLHSDQFPDTEAGAAKARVCFKEMSLNLADMEALAAKAAESAEAEAVIAGKLPNPFLPELTSFPDTIQPFCKLSGGAVYQWVDDEAGSGYRPYAPGKRKK